MSRQNLFEHFVLIFAVYRWIRCHQCDQIGRFSKVFAINLFKYSRKYFWAIRRYVTFYEKTILVTVRAFFCKIRVILPGHTGGQTIFTLA